MSQRQYVSRDRRPPPSTGGGIPRATYRHDAARETSRADVENSERDTKKNGFSYYDKKEDRGIPRSTAKPSTDAKVRPKSSTLVHSQEYVAESYRREAGSKGIIDMTLSRHVRQISKEEDKEGKVAAIAALKAFMVDSKNFKVIIKANESLWNGLSDYFTDRSQRAIRTEVAICLGMTGIMACRASRSDAARYMEWIFGKLNSMESDEVKMLYIVSLQEVLTCEDLQTVLLDSTEIIMENMLSILETAENPELLRRAISLALCIADKYPDGFLLHFEDVVDILIGWHIESTPGSAVMHTVSDALISLHHHWSSKMRLCATLLRQFLEDAEDLRRGSSSEPRGKVLSKIISLFRVFYTVVEAAGDLFSASKTPYIITHDYICEIIERLLQCASIVGSHSPVRNVEFMSITNLCLATILAAADCDVNKHRTYLLCFLRDQIPEVHGLPYDYQVSLLVCLTKAVRASRSQLSVTYIQGLLSSVCLRKLRISPSAHVLQAILHLYKALLDVRDVKVLQEVYRFTMADIELSLRCLNGCQDVHLLDVNPLAGTVMTEYEAEVYAVFDATSLHDIAESTSNLISMYALSPGIFDMLWRTVLLPHHEVLRNHPAVHFAFLHLLYVHCSSHGQFFGTTTLLARSGMTSVRPGENPPQTREYFSNTLKLLAKMLATGQLPSDSLELMLKWITELTKLVCASSGPRHLLTSPELIELFISLTDYDLSVVGEEAICCVLSEICLTLVSSQAIPIVLHQRIYEVCTVNLANAGSGTVRDASMRLLRAIPCELPLRRFWSLNNSPAQCSKVLQRCWAARRHTMSKTSGDFHAEHFRFVAAFILKGLGPTSQEAVLITLERMLYSSQRRGSCYTAFPTDMAMDHHRSQLWFWALWEAANYCLLNKLRTPIGKPQDTFLTIENCLKALAVLARQKGDEPSQAGLFVSLRDAHGLATGSCPQQVIFLLQFMENLEKLLYSAYEGTAVAIPSQSKNVRAFFRTNRGTCTEWLARIRMPMMVVAAACGQHAAVVRIGYELLRDAKKNVVLASQNVEFERTIANTIHALTRMNCPDAIHGLVVWCKEVFGKKLTWARPAAEKAWHRYENAAGEFKAALNTQLDQAAVPPAPKADRILRSAEADELEQASEELRRLLVIPRPSSQLVAGSEWMPDSSILSAPIAAVGIGYCADEATDCYAKLQNWSDVLEWLSTLHELRKRQLQSDTGCGSVLSGELYGHVDSNFASALTRFDEGRLADVESCLALVPGASLTQSKPAQFLGSVPLWSSKNILQGVHVKMLATGLLALVPQHRNSEAAIRDCLTAAESLVEETLHSECFSCPSIPSDDGIFALHGLAMLRSALLEHEPALLPCCAGGSKMNCVDVGVGWLQSAIRVLDIEALALSPVGDEDINSASRRLSSHTTLLRVAAARLARKQLNFRTAEKLLSVPSAAMGIPLRRELAKLLHATGRTSEAVDLAVGICGDLLERRPKGCVSVLEAGSEVLTARTLLSLVQWVQADSKCLATYVTTFGPDAVIEPGPLKAARKKLSNLLGDCLEVTVEDSELLTSADVFVGRLYELSCKCCPTLSKAWFTLAGWCYKWGRKVIDASVQGSVRLTADEQAQAAALLKKDVSPQQCESILQIIGEVHAGAAITPTNEEDIADAANEGATYEDGTEAVRRKLFALLPTFPNGQPSIDPEKLTSIWRSVVNRVYRLYGMSARAYFTYLKLGSSNSSGDSTVLQEQAEGDRDVTATLRLLRLLVKHAWELRDHLEQGFAGTPTAPWKGIVPQLFSRLGHPEPYVRLSVLGLLSRVAHDTPQLIVYPAIVGAMRGRDESQVKAFGREGDNLVSKYLSSTTTTAEGPLTTSMVAGSNEEDEEEEENYAYSDNEQAESGSALCDSFQALVDVLTKNDPVMISQVKTFVDELCRITVLWDELWLGTLSQHHTTVTEKLRQLELEVDRVHANNSLDASEKELLISEKHRVLLKPTVCLFERLLDVTARPPETLHEKWFQSAYGKLIESALERLRCPTNPGCPQTSWALFRQLHHSLQQRAQKRSSLLLKMNEISGHLASLKGTTIAMPSLSLTRGGSSSSSAVMIDSVCNTVQILPTKTKPKKLIFIGTDGKKYPYLFKGLEDLHLDERIMQFLSIVNNMLAATSASSSSSEGQRPLHRARHYSVTPLGTRSGLIQWVDGSTPLFLLYKRWQQREAAADMSSSSASLSALAHSAGGPRPGGGSTSYGGTGAIVVPRPSEVFYTKLIPLLRPLLEERGATRADVEKLRRDWPLASVCSALESLQAETPDDLVAREIWCSATGSAEWWQLTQAYCRSVAVMSVVGFVIGLGDRHLDNLLLDLSTGEVIHIDYNVCFDKGKSLRVPERVPFRMTQNIKAALGVTGIEGTFRSSCEHVLRTMRKGRETLLTLLEAFVYDPLVDWTLGSESGLAGAMYGGVKASAIELRAQEKSMDQEITSTMFSIRIVEIKAQWMSNRNEIVSTLNRLLEEITAAVQLFEESRLIQHREVVSMLLKSALTDAKTNLDNRIYSLPRRFGEYTKVKLEQEEIEEVIRNKLAECDTWQRMHMSMGEFLGGPGLTKMAAEVGASLVMPPTPCSFAADFLQTAGQVAIVRECEQLDGELAAALRQRRHSMVTCCEALHTYAAILAQFPPTYLEDNRTCQFQKWLARILSNFTVAECLEVEKEHQEKYGATHVATKAQLAAATDFRLQSILTEATARHAKAAERPAGAAAAAVQEQCAAQQRALADMQGHAAAGSDRAVVACLLAALATQGRRWLQTERTAAQNEGKLMDLVSSRDGDWYIDDLSSGIHNMHEMAEVLRLVSKGRAPPGLSASQPPSLVDKAHHVLDTVDHVYASLQEMHFNFRSIILPESMKHLLRQEACVIQAIERLNADVIKSINMKELCTQLELMLRNTIITRARAVHPEASGAVRDLRKAYDALISDYSQTATIGQKLLVGFNGLFVKLDADFAELMSAFVDLDVPVIWKKVDLVAEGRNRQLGSFGPLTDDIVLDLLFVRRLHVMQEFFTFCTRHVHAMQYLGDASVLHITLLDEESIARPMRKFVADFVSRQLIGLPEQALGSLICSYLQQRLMLNVTAEIELKDIGASSKVAVEDLCKKAADQCLRSGGGGSGPTSQGASARAAALVSAYDNALRQADVSRRLEKSSSLGRNTLRQAQMQLVRFQWLHEDVLVHSGKQLAHFAVPARAQILTELRKSMHVLQQLENGHVEILEKLGQLEASISQRLRWAAGVNPSLAAVLTTFEEAQSRRSSSVHAEARQSSELSKLCNSLLHFEALRTRTTEAMAHDSNFLLLLQRSRQSCEALNSADASISEIEDLLMRLLPVQPAQVINSSWLERAMEETRVQSANIDKGAKALKKAAEECKEKIKVQVLPALHTAVLTNHHKLISEVRIILKSLAKQEEADRSSTRGHSRDSIRNYLTKYKTFSEDLTALLRAAMSAMDEGCLLPSASVPADAFATIQSLTKQVLLQIDYVYDKLIEFAKPLAREEFGRDDIEIAGPIVEPATKRLVAVAGGLLCTDSNVGFVSSGTHLQSIVATPRVLRTSMAKKGPEKVARDPTTGKAIQERNSYAVSVWRRVKMKLEGRESDANKRLSVPEQIDGIIKEATELKNLALMYEGWTSWV